MKYEQEEEAMKAYNALAKYTFTEKEVGEKILGAQAVYVTKLLNLREALATRAGMDAAQVEFLRMVQNGVWKDPVEADTLGENDVIIRTQLLISRKFAEMEGKWWVLKGRFVGMGHRLYDKFMKVIANPDHDDL